MFYSRFQYNGGIKKIDMSDSYYVGGECLLLNFTIKSLWISLGCLLAEGS